MISTTTMDPCQFGHCYINGRCKCGAFIAGYAPTPGLTVAARELTPGEMTSLEKISALRGFAGRQRAAIRNALDQLRPEHPAAKVLRDALGEKAP